VAQQERTEAERLAALERRLQALEDVEALRNLKARYAALCDAGYDADGIAALFTEDGVWESKGVGPFVGREAIRGFFRGASSIYSFAIHYALNGRIEVSGDSARAQYYSFMPCTLAGTGRAMWRAGTDDEEYRRVDGLWMYRRKSSAPFFFTPFEDGWAKTRFI
jgi:ketosteroid isomerase-like protein